MAVADEGEAMYEALMAVKPEGLSLNRWAQRAGINRSIFNGIKAHGNPTSKTLERLLTAIDVDPALFRARLQPVRTEVRGTGLSAQEAANAWRGPDRATPVPLVGSAYGGEFEEDIEMVELHLAEVLDYLGRPHSLAGDDKGYAVEIVGDSMAPRFEPGERAFVSPRSPVRPGDDVIVQLRAAVGEDRQRNDYADRVTMVLIKRLVRQGANFIELRQFNPDRTFRVEMARVAAVHRVRDRL
jgi:SOS-response transcriptional repressor LexA